MNSKETNRPVIFAAKSLCPRDFKKAANSNSPVLYGISGCVSCMLVVIVVIDSFQDSRELQEQRSRRILLRVIAHSPNAALQECGRVADDLVSAITAQIRL
jgi:hypothetical protein